MTKADVNIEKDIAPVEPEALGQRELRTRTNKANAPEQVSTRAAPKQATADAPGKMAPKASPSLAANGAAKSAPARTTGRMRGDLSALAVDDSVRDRIARVEAAVAKKQVQAAAVRPKPKPKPRQKKTGQPDINIDEMAPTVVARATALAGNPAVELVDGVCSGGKALEVGEYGFE